MLVDFVGRYPRLSQFSMTDTVRRDTVTGHILWAVAPHMLPEFINETKC